LFFFFHFSLGSCLKNVPIFEEEVLADPLLSSLDELLTIDGGSVLNI
jgi:hypothetical protein